MHILSVTDEKVLEKSKSIWDKIINIIEKDFNKNPVAERI